MKTAKQPTTQKTAKSQPTQSRTASTAQAKPGQSRKPTSESAPGSSEALQGKPVMQHDLKGFALICLPAQMRQILGEKACEERIRQIQEMAMVLIVRELEKVLFVDLAFRVVEPGADGLQLRPVNAGDASPDKVKTKNAKARTKSASRQS